MFTNHIHYSQDLEQAILGACMLENTAFGRTYSLVTAESFYFDGHKEIYDTLKTMYENGMPIDTFTVVDYLVRLRGYENFHGHNVPYFVTRLNTFVVSTAHLEYHCHVVHTMWMERELIKLTHSGTADGDIKNKVKTLQENIQKIMQGSYEKEWVDMTELMIKLYQHQEEMKKTEGKGITTGLWKLDKENGGFHPGNMIVIGARPSVGKSALIGQMAIEMAKTKKKVGIISLEMSNREIAARLVSLDSDIDFQIVYRGLYTDENQRDKLYNIVSQRTAHLPIFVSDKTEVNVNEIRAKAAKLKALHGLDVLIIDYLQLIDEKEVRNSTRENEVRKISRACKIMAKEMEIPVIVLCQLNREVTKRTGNNRYPQLSDLRESGAIEQDADVVMFLHRDWMSGIETNENGYSTEKEADLVIRKWRNGVSNWIIKLDFDGPTMKFTERRESKFIPVKIEQDDKDETPF